MRTEGRVMDDNQKSSKLLFTIESLEYQLEKTLNAFDDVFVEDYTKWIVKTVSCQEVGDISYVSFSYLGTHGHAKDKFLSDIRRSNKYDTISEAIDVMTAKAGTLKEGYQITANTVEEAYQTAISTYKIAIESFKSELEVLNGRN